MSELLFPFEMKSNLNNSPWHLTDQDEWERLFNDAPIKVLNKNKIVFHQGHPLRYVYFIKKGRVRSSISDVEGKEQTILIFSEGSIFGEVSAIEEMSYIVTATTNTACTLAYMPYSEFLKKIEGSPSLSMNLSRSLTRKMLRLTNQVKNIALLSSDERVITYLLKLADSFGELTDQGIKIAIAFTHQEMADLIATSRVSVSKMMSCLTKEGILERIDGYLYIKDRAALLEWL